MLPCSPIIALLLGLPQQTAPTTPASGDTIGYWQQHVDYRIAGTLDEERGVLEARAQLAYANNSPDTLRVFYVHQYLNAFRPGSKWSAADEREGRVRFQHLVDPDFAYERFTATPTFDGVPVAPEYPGAPDSTVALFVLPQPLPPGDTLHAAFEWEARPSTLPRRQARRGRSFDFAQWYPKVAVYDRLGWRQNPLVPAGELYGEFGSYDVTLAVRDDQVLGATGVLVQGDAGWRGALRGGEVFTATGAYGELAPGLDVDVPAGYKRVRFHAENVHHYAWSTSPDYMYEGTVYVRPAATLRHTPFVVFDSVPVHVLYRPGDEESWGNGVAVERTILALRWLELLYGPYAYPQITNLHRIEGGGTEFPMVIMDGSASQGLILHELGHVFTYGILGNNEWRSGWLDEGITSYQTAMAGASTPQDTASDQGEPQQREGYRAHAVLPTGSEAGQIEQYRLDMIGRAEPIGTAAHEFNEFGIYGAMIYSRAETMYGQLRDVMGDEAFRKFLSDYYHMWALRHVDERAIRAAAERVHGEPLDWFFRQWVHETGLIDYGLADVDVERAETGWVTRAQVVKLGEYEHPMPVGVRTERGWTVVRAEPFASRQTVSIRTGEQPLEVALDPFSTTEDWDRRNDSRPGALGGSGPRIVFDWPFLEQWSRDRNVIELGPVAWYSGPGGLTLGATVNTGYQGWLDEWELGFAVTTRAPDAAEDASFGGDRIQAWATVENPRILPRSGPAVGLSLGFWLLDGIARASVEKRWDHDRFVYSAGRELATRVGIDIAYPFSREFVPELWGNDWTIEPNFGVRWRNGRGGRGGGVERSAMLRASAGLSGETLGSLEGVYARGEAALSQLTRMHEDDFVVFLRGYAGWSGSAPVRRHIFASAQSPDETFANHLYRPREAVLKQDGVNFVPLGGAGLRGYSPRLEANALVALNAEAAYRILEMASTPRPLALWASVFADGGVLFNPDVSFPADPGLPPAEPRFFDRDETLVDAGLGVSLRGRLFDRDVTLRVDFPLYVREPGLAVDGREDPVDFRWTFSFSDLW
ncbi:MAG: M1 family aminopeptidase [Gemmatimonadaceae bacterium]